MASLRPIYRPSIRDLSNFLLSPQSASTRRCISAIHQSKPSELPHKSTLLSTRTFTTTASLSASPKPSNHDRGPASTEDTQTDFGALNVLGGTPAPSTSIDACLWDGFHLDSGVKITGGTGVLLVAGEAFAWRPWEAKEGLRLVNQKGQWDVEDEAWGLLELVWPKPGM